ncbi:hypothetical protein HU200_005893 [Digitaria exilis]|uniref:Uncharacterized protein n=1 Tax=Digitaria exilis TaxID=1010633 RepID=A0A835FQ86_9POAL|nr:hypothetical protein HU200_005893 [Digitaria exilis]
MAGREDSLARGTTASATRTNAEVEDQPAAAAAAERKPKSRLTKVEIRRILAGKPTPAPARFAALKQSNPELIPRPGEEADEDKRRLYRLVKAFYEMEERLPRLQEWVRGKLKRKGHVEIDDETARRRAEVQAVIDREWPEIEAKMKELILSEKEEYRGSEGDDDSDSDDGEDEMMTNLTREAIRPARHTVNLFLCPEGENGELRRPPQLLTDEHHYPTLSFHGSLSHLGAIVAAVSFSRGWRKKAEPNNKTPSRAAPTWQRQQDATAVGLAQFNWQQTGPARGATKRGPQQPPSPTHSPPTPTRSVNPTPTRPRVRRRRRRYRSRRPPPNPSRGKEAEFPIKLRDLPAGEGQFAQAMHRRKLGDGGGHRRTAGFVEELLLQEEGEEGARGLVGRTGAAKAKEHAASATAAEAETEVAAGAAVQNRLSAKEIRWILCQKAQPPPPPYQALKRSNPELTPRPGEEDDEEKMTMYVLARAFYELEERLPKMQEKVRSELKNKGYVEVDDEYHKCKAEAQAVIDREAATRRKKKWRKE